RNLSEPDRERGRYSRTVVYPGPIRRELRQGAADRGPRGRVRPRARVSRRWSVAPGSAGWERHRGRAPLDAPDGEDRDGQAGRRPGRRRATYGVDPGRRE